MRLSFFFFFGNYTKKGAHKGYDVMPFQVVLNCLWKLIRKPTQKRWKYKAKCKPNIEYGYQREKKSGENKN